MGCRSRISDLNWLRAGTLHTVWDTYSRSAKYFESRRECHDLRGRLVSAPNAHSCVDEAGSSIHRVFAHTRSQQTRLGKGAI